MYSTEAKFGKYLLFNLSVYSRENFTIQDYL